MTLAAKPLRVLNVEDRRHDPELLSYELSNSGYLAQWQRVETEADFLSALGSEPDIILADYALPRFSGLRALELLKQSHRDIPFIFVSTTLGEDKAVEAMRLGADDYLLEDHIPRLGPAVITALERKCARAELRRLEIVRLQEGEIHRQIFEQAACGIAIVSLDWRYRAANEVLCRMLGRSRGELIGMSVADVTHPDDVTVSASLREALLSGSEEGLVQPLEKRYQRPDGTIVWAEVTASLVSSPVPGEESHLVATMLDISARKSVEEAREVSRQFAQSTIDSLAQPLCVVDESGRILAVNRAWQEITNLEGSYLAFATLGANYLDVCELAQGPDLCRALEFAAGVREVIGGVRDLFTLEYSVHAQDQERWLQSRVTRFQGVDPVRITIVHTDVTSRVLALSNLRESEIRFRGTFEQAAMGIAHISLEGRFLLVNSKLCTILGYKRAALLNMRLQDLMVPEDRPSYLKSRVRILAGEQESDACDSRFVQESGETVWINLVTNVERASGGAPRYFVSIFKEISVRKLAEFRLQRLNRLHSVLKGISDIIVRTRERQELFDAACRIVVNQGLLRMAYVGLVDEEARVVRPVASCGAGLEYLEQPTSIIPMDGGPLGQGTMGTAMRTGTHDYCNNIAESERMKPWHEATTRNGLLANASFPLYLRGKIVAVLALFAGEVNYFQHDELHLMEEVAKSMSFALEALAVDHERRLAAELLRRQQSELSTLFDLVPAMLCIKNTENGFLRVNQRLAEAVGKSVQEMEGKSAFDLFPAEAAAYFADDLEVIRTGKAKLGIVEQLRGSPNGGLWVQTDKVPYRDEQGNVIGLIAMVRDITEIKQAQESLRLLNTELEERVATRTEELERARLDAEKASRSKSTFLATMSHEIRTPMNGVLGMLELLPKTGLTRDQQQMVQLIRESALSLLALIDDILDFSKIEAGKFTISQEPLNLAALVEKVCAMLDVVAVKSGVRLTVFADPAIPEKVIGDETRLRQVLINLIGNAIKFSSRSEVPGRVSVRAILLDRADDHAMVDLTVTDNGIGIDEATLERLFAPFEQADSSTTRRFGGSGLGLTITRSLVQLMGGEISALSKLGVGSTFSVRLDLAVPEGVLGEQGIDESLRGLRCKVVGSETPLRDDLTAYLRSAHISVEQSLDLSAAAAASRPPGLCVWIVLPDQSSISPSDLRALTPRESGSATGFLVLGYGPQRRARVEAPDFVSIDIDSMSRESLFETLAFVAGRHFERDSASLSSPSSPIQAPVRIDLHTRERPILVAEDNETNREVIRRQLEYLGFGCVVVASGKLALEHWREGRVGLLLTDLRMPQMDGYALSAAIRAEEREGRRTPIIALTASRLPEEARRCEASGIDEYLTKPVELSVLKATIERWLSISGAAESAHIDIGDSVQPTLTVDVSVLAALVGDTPEGIDDLLRTFRSGARRSSDAIAKEIGDSNWSGVADLAHSLKSGARAIGAYRLGSICEAMEDSAEAGDVARISELIPEFSAELRNVFDFLDSR